MSEQKIVDIQLDERSILRRHPDIEHERRVAIFDLLEDNHFAPRAGQAGPFHVLMRVEESRLVLEVKSPDGRELESIALALSPFRRVIKSYWQICESYYSAIKTASPSQIEAIDMGRRGIHNEGSELLKERLADRVEIDFNTARRLFTLICVLHLRG